MAMSKEDFRKPRKNPEISFLVRMIREKTRELAREKDHSVRKGLARVLIAHLEALDGEPEFLCDLMEGPAALQDAYFRPDEFDPGAVIFSVETPFDRPGEAQGRYFFHSGRLSCLYEGVAKDPHVIQKPFSGMGLWNFCVEKLYASSRPTTMHAVDETIFKKALGGHKVQVPRPGQWAYLVCADPCGIRGGRKSAIAAHTTELKKAVEIAERLGDLLDIRFVAGKVVYAFLNH